MNYKLATSVFAFGSMLASASVFATGSDVDSAKRGTYVKDSVITVKIKAKLAEEHPGSMAHIKVDTDKNGVVWMTGTANSRDEVNEAVAIAKNTEGVKSVHNQLKVQKDK